jgi:hypothetical protein
MTETLNAPIYRVPQSDRRNTWLDFAEVTPLPRTLLDFNVAGGELAQNHLYKCVRLDWEDLQCFEVVNHQFQDWGVAFANAIALRPSNPAYPPYSGVMVLMGAPKQGWLETTFSQPVRFVSGFITSSRRTVLTAFDHHDRVVARTESAGANLANSNLANSNLANSKTSHAPNVKLSLYAPNICRVTFQTFNGHLTLDDFCFGF